jgi:hypothetical protein
MFNKNNEALANAFNRKQTRDKEVARLNNFYTNRPSKVIPFHVKREKDSLREEEGLLKNPEIFTFGGIRTSATIDLNMNHHLETNIVSTPVITYKELDIPIFSEHDKFDLNSIGNKIHVSVPMNVFIGDEYNMGDVNRLKKKKVQKINHIYKKSYAFGVNATGFGDFVRSCFYIIQFCKKYGFQYEFFIHHPVALFLEKFYKGFQMYRGKSDTFLRSISMFSPSNLKDTIFNRANNDITDFVLSGKVEGEFIDYLCGLKMVNNSVYSYNTLFPYDDINEVEKREISELLRPNEEMRLYLQETLDSFKLVRKKYVIFHIRSGDKYLKNETKVFDSLYLNTIYSDIRSIMEKRGGGSDYFLIGDNNEVKYLICQKFSIIKTSYKEITHLGEGIDLEREKVKNTMLDFYLIANAAAIFSYTVYPHGTGFSYWCAKVYDVPYTCKYINF